MRTNPRLIPSLELVERTLAAELSYTLSRMQVLERIPGNPIGIAYRRIDTAAAALMAPVLPHFNCVVGLSAKHEKHVEPLVQWYRDHGVKPRFEMVPGLYDPGLGRELGRLGYYHSGFHAAVIGDPDVEPVLDDKISDDKIDVERVGSAEALEEYLDAYVAGWGIADKDRVQFKSNVRPWLDQPGWSLYLGRIDGRAAAAATLYVHDRVGYLADAATDPSCRRHGLQLALLRRRIRDAGTAGVNFVCSGADPLSTSHRNMERAGMRVLFMRAKWTQL